MNQTRTGLGLGILAYTIWGTFPFYFILISRVNALEAVSWRVLTTFIFCVFLIVVTRRWNRVKKILTDKKQIWWFVLSSILLYLNWQIFVLGVMMGHVLETSLGYFMNPLVTILLGVFFRKEKLRNLQWIAVAIAAAGVLISAIAYGKIPWIAILLALTFGFYGAVHKKIESEVDGITGLTVETFVAAPIALVQGLIIYSLMGLTAYTYEPWFFMLVLMSGLITAIPLILFGEAARRLPLSYLGFIQFITPILSFLYGFFIADETMSWARWIGFIAVWIALVVLIIDMIIQIRQTPLGKEPSLNTEPIPLD